MVDEEAMVTSIKEEADVSKISREPEEEVVRKSKESRFKPTGRGLKRVIKTAEELASPACPDVSQLVEVKNEVPDDVEFQDVEVKNELMESANVSCKTI